MQKVQGEVPTGLQRQLSVDRGDRQRAAGVVHRSISLSESVSSDMDDYEPMASLRRKDDDYILMRSAGKAGPIEYEDMLPHPVGREKIEQYTVVTSPTRRCVHVHSYLVYVHMYVCTYVCTKACLYVCVQYKVQYELLYSHMYTCVSMYVSVSRHANGTVHVPPSPHSYVHCSSMKKSSSADNLLAEGLYASPRVDTSAAVQQAPPLPPPPTYDAIKTRVSLAVLCCVGG